MRRPAAEARAISALVLLAAFEVEGPLLQERVLGYGSGTVYRSSNVVLFTSR